MIPLIIPLIYLQVILRVLYEGKAVTNSVTSEGELYTATVSDFSGSDPLIYKEPLRTEQYDSKILNSKSRYLN